MLPDIFFLPNSCLLGLFKCIAMHCNLILFANFCQIVHWRNYLHFPEDARLTPEAKDLICRLLCDVEHRLGTGGAHQIKVKFHV